MSLVIDTGVLVAAARTGEPEHAACATLLREAAESRVVPAPVLVEVEYLLRASPAWANLMRDVHSGALVVAELDMQSYARIDDLLRTYADMRVGFVDCAVLAVVERLEESKLATLDNRHFTVMRPAHIDALDLLPSAAS